MNDDLIDLFQDHDAVPADDPLLKFAAERAAGPVSREDVARAIEVSQAAFQSVVNELTELYRNLDKTYRKDIKTKLKAAYDKLADLGATFGVSRVSMTNLWRG